MDIYQCMTCGQQWPHGGMQSSFIAVAQHADETRGAPEGMHAVRIGERQHLEDLYRRHQAGEVLVVPNDHESVFPPVQPVPEPPPQTLTALARRLGVTEMQARELVRSLFEPPERAMPSSAQDDVIPPGQLMTWGDR